MVKPTPLPLRANFRKGVLTPHQIGNSQAFIHTYQSVKLALNSMHPVMPHSLTERDHLKL